MSVRSQVRSKASGLRPLGIDLRRFKSCRTQLGWHPIITADVPPSLDWEVLKKSRSLASAQRVIKWATLRTNNSALWWISCSVSVMSPRLLQRVIKRRFAHLAQLVEPHAVKVCNFVYGMGHLKTHYRYVVVGGSSPSVGAAPTRRVINKVSQHSAGHPEVTAWITSLPQRVTK